MLRLKSTCFVCAALLVLSTTAAFAQFGCTDPCACNYDPDAVFDTGFCTYDHCIEIEISADGNVGADNSRWEIRDAYGRVQHARQAVNTTISCSGMDCFTFHVYDDGGDGWGQFGGYTIFVDGEIVLDEGFDSGNYDTMNASTPECNAVFGCNIPFACNYSPSATFFDGSCTYEGCTDPSAENYEPEAGCDSGNCVYSTTCDGLPEAPDGRQQGFTGYLSPENWVPYYGNGNGTIDHNSNTVVMVSSDKSTIDWFNSETSIQRLIQYPGDITFDWEYYTLDSQSSLDEPIASCGAGGDLTSSNESGQDSNQFGTYTLACASSANIFLAIVADVASGSTAPGFLKITNLRTPSFQCGCRISSACNYNPDTMTGPEDCDFSCRTCNDPEACNYIGSLNPIGAVTPPVIYNGLISEYDWESAEAAQAFYDANFPLTPCLPNPPEVGCDCLAALTQSGTSAWIQQEGSSETDVLNLPYSCKGYELMGCFGGLFSTVIADYPCTNRPLVFFSNAHESDIVINVQAGTPELLIIGESYNSTVTVNHAPGTSVVLLDDDLILTENIVQIGNCGCTNAQACNYDPTAVDDSGGCRYPDGCDDPNAFNFNPDIQNCLGRCIYLDACNRLGNVSEGLQAGFSGVYDPALWTSGVTAGDGSVNFGQQAVTVTGDNSGQSNAIAQTSLVLPHDGVYSFDWAYSTTDFPGNDPASCFASEVIPLSDDFGGQSQQGSFSFQGTAGDIFSLAIESIDGQGGAAQLIITRFMGPGLPPCQPGCTSPWACNYDPAAQDDDGSCSYEGCGGCTISIAVNYDPEAVYDDGSCIIEETCPADLDNSGDISTGDLLIVLAAFGTACPD